VNLHIALFPPVINNLLKKEKGLPVIINRASPFLLPDFVVCIIGFLNVLIMRLRSLSPAGGDWRAYEAALNAASV
jgi:hypothetical protein